MVINGWTKMCNEVRELKNEVDRYKQLWNEETQLVEQMQKDKDYMDKKLMVAQGIVNELPYSDVYKTLLTKLIMKARSRV